MKRQEGNQNHHRCCMINGQSSNRDVTLDIAKAICIILMVIGHSGCPAYLSRFLYMFHMPCFFFISGYLLGDNNICNLKFGLSKKVKSTYYPFVKWTLIFIVLHNLFAMLGIYETSYTWSICADRVVRAFALRGSEQLLGGFWFLISLFWASVFVLLYLSMLKRIKKLTPLFTWTGGAIMLAFACSLSLLPISLPTMFQESTIMATVFYLSGYNMKCSRWIRSKSSITLLLVPFVVAFFSSFSIHVKGWDCIVYYLVAMSGTIGTFAVADLISKTGIRQMLSYIGKRTLHILVFHFLAFKLVSFFYIIYSNMPISCLSQFPVLKVCSNWLWLVYSIAGVSVSLIIEKLISINSKWSVFIKR